MNLRNQEQQAENAQNDKVLHFGLLVWICNRSSAVCAGRRPQNERGFNMFALFMSWHSLRFYYEYDEYDRTWDVYVNRFRKGCGCDTFFVCALDFEEEASDVVCFLNKIANNIKKNAEKASLMEVW